ncbi:hypothetical protein SCG7109_AH_00260 [Chlamydiales bacterium SCGC AG-110-M15]|nr:hypothetical protein SCG7109_AH_00260 [Chlamydiales bacterium SCGC AG-110-M15]
MSNEIYSSFWEHLEDFRQTLIRCLIIILLGTLTSLFFYDQVFALLQKPLINLSQTDAKNNDIRRFELRRERFQNVGKGDISYKVNKPVDGLQIHLSERAVEADKGNFILPPGAYLDVEHPKSSGNLLILSPLDGMTSTFKVSIWFGLLGSSPFTLFLLLRFFSPALRANERSLLMPFLFLSLMFISIGLACGLYISTPLANQFLYAFNSYIGLNLWTLDSYLSYSLFMLFSHGMAFELCLVLLFAVHLGLISPSQMREKRRFYYVGAFVLGAILTPPDVFTQFMMASLLIAFYELAILYARFKQLASYKRKKA